MTEQDERECCSGFLQISKYDLLFKAYTLSTENSRQREQNNNKKVQIFWTANLKVAWGIKTRRGKKASDETGERKVKPASIEKFLWDIHFLRQTSGLNSKYLRGLLWQLRLKRAGAD